MKRCLVLLLLLARLTLAQTDPAGVMAQANLAYQNGDYATAVQLYQSLVDKGIVNAAVYFNLGSAYYQSDDLGYALVNLLRAQMHVPRDGELNRSLALVRSARVDIQGDETGLIEGFASLTNSTLTFTELGWLALIFWCAWFALLIMWVLRMDWREGLRVLLLVGAAVVIFAVVSLASRWWVLDYRPAAVVVQQQVQVMSGPGENYLELFMLHAAAEVRFVEIRDGWVRFALPDSRQGWLPADALKRV